MGRPMKKATNGRPSHRSKENLFRFFLIRALFFFLIGLCVNKGTVLYHELLFVGRAVAINVNPDLKFVLLSGIVFLSKFITKAVLAAEQGVDRLQIVWYFTGKRHFEVHSARFLSERI